MANKVISDGAYLQLYLEGLVHFAEKDTFSVQANYGGVAGDVALFLETTAAGLPYYVGQYTLFDEPVGTSAADLKAKIDALLVILAPIEQANVLKMVSLRG